MTRICARVMEAVHWYAKASHQDVGMLSDLFLGDLPTQSAEVLECPAYMPAYMDCWNKWSKIKDSSELKFYTEELCMEKINPGMSTFIYI